MLEYSREGLRIDSDRTTEKWQKVKHDRKGRKRVGGGGEDVCEEEKGKASRNSLASCSSEKGLLLG